VLLIKESKGDKVPALENKPELYEDLIPVWNNYIALQEREKTIRPESIESWLRIHEVIPEERQEMTRLILLLNGRFIQHVNANSKKKGK